MGMDGGCERGVDRCTRARRARRTKSENSQRGASRQRAHACLKRTVVGVGGEAARRRVGGDRRQAVGGGARQRRRAARHVGCRLAHARGRRSRSPRLPPSGAPGQNVIHRLARGSPERLSAGGGGAPPPALARSVLSGSSKQRVWVRRRLPRVISRRATRARAARSTRRRAENFGLERRHPDR